MNGIQCPEGHQVEDLYYKRVGESDTIVCCRKCDQAT